MLTPKAGSSIGPYRIRRRIARSRWTSVFSVEEKDVNGRLVLKLFDLNGSHQKYIGTPEEQIWRNRFDLEARVLAAIENPAIISLHDRGIYDDGRPYHVMPYVNANLAYEIKFDISQLASNPRLKPPLRYGPLGIERTLSLTGQILEGVSALHEKEILHRDLKPGNVLLSRIGDGRAIICDFGMARWGDEAFDVSDELIGSKAYVSPEQREDHGASDARADVYSIGLMIFRMLAGKRPENKERSMRVYNDKVSVYFDKVVAACISPKPDDRPDDARQMLDALKPVLG